MLKRSKRKAESEIEASSVGDAAVFVSPERPRKLQHDVRSQQKAADVMGSSMEAVCGWRAEEMVSLRKENAALKAQIAMREAQLDLLLLSRPIPRPVFASYILDEYNARIASSTAHIFSPKVGVPAHHKRDFSLDTDLTLVAEIIAHPVCSALLKDFANEAKALESVDFLLAVEAYEAASSAGRSILGPHIVQEFVSESSLHEVNISASVSAEIVAHAAKRDWVPNLFKIACVEIRRLVAQNLMHGFRLSPQWALVEVALALGGQAVQGEDDRLSRHTPWRKIKKLMKPGEK